MRCPSLHELPAPPAGKTGWPWTGETYIHANVSHEGDWPRISIVTPSYNQGQFLEETIRSVLLQGYPNLEYIIIDGGSVDNSVEIIKKYEPWLAYWISEPDKGQAHAINKGFSRASGEVLGWLNSDDYFLPGALNILAALIQSYPDAVAWVGACYDIDIDGNRMALHIPRLGDKAAFADWWEVGYFCQPGCLFRRDAFLKINGLNERLNFVLDVDLWMRLAEIGEFAFTDESVATSRLYKEAKTFQDIPMREVEHIAINFNLEEREIAKKRLLRFAKKYSQQHIVQIAEGYLKSLGIIRLAKLVSKLAWARVINKIGQTTFKEPSHTD